MSPQLLLLEAARAVSSETIEADVSRVAAEGILRLVGAERAGWVSWVDAAPAGMVATADGDAASDAAVLFGVGEAARTQRSFVTEQSACVPVIDDGTVLGVLFASRGAGEPPPNPSDVASIEALGSFVAVSLRNVAMFSSLETLVAHEMTRVVEREASMQLVLDSMAEGLLVCDVTGTVGPIRSKAALTWFGTPEPGVKLDAYLADPAAADCLAMGFELLGDAIMPFDLVADQVPKLVVRDDRTYRLGFQPVLEDDQLTQVVVTVRDVTAELAQQRADRINGEIQVIVGILLRDRPGFQAFTEEIGTLFVRLAECETLSESQRILHTIKGNACMYGFSVFGDACHELESRVAGDAGHMSPANLARLERDWLEALERVSMFLVDDDAGSVRLSGGDYGVLLESLDRRADHTELARLVLGWREPKVAAVLGPYASTAKLIASRLDKVLEVIIEDGGLRLPREELRSFCATLVHVLRNAIDHGLESAAERRAAGKPATGRLLLGARMDASSFVMSVEDDGRGIDWARVAEKARAAGVPATTERELLEALFSDGVSTCDDVTTLSGRGVGLGAARARCAELGGTLSVRSERGRGTRFEFAFPS